MENHKPKHKSSFVSREAYAESRAERDSFEGPLLKPVGPLCMRGASLFLGGRRILLRLHAERLGSTMAPKSMIKLLWASPRHLINLDIMVSLALRASHKLAKARVIGGQNVEANNRQSLGAQYEEHNTRSPVLGAQY